MDALDRHLPYALRQFEVDVLFTLHLLGLDLPVTTATQAKVTAVALILLFFHLAIRRAALVPGRAQAAAEWVYLFVAETVIKNAGTEARSAIPFLFTLFIFVLVGTLIGITPLKETFTTGLVLTLALALLVFAYVNVVAFRRHGFGFFRFFLPDGVPAYVAPLVVTVEVISYLVRPLTLGIRIFVNIVAGHIMLKLFADFCAMLIDALGIAGIALTALPIIVMVLLYAFEIMIVAVQSYIFILISSLYLRDSLKSH